MPEQIGKYRVLERIGHGGMGTVFKAHDPVLDRPVALKVISPDIEVTDDLRARFFREAQACARLSHPNIVTIYDMGEQDGRLFIVMELLDGEELRRLIAQRKPLALEDKLSVIAQICDGLHYAHQKGIVHRDVKPGNIFLLRNGQVKILDFGIAQIATIDGGLTRTGLIMGTLRYIAPEQVHGRANTRSDIYSVGAVCYELLGLRPPFAGDDPIHLLEQLRTEEPTPLHGLDPSLPLALIAIVERAMRKDPQERYVDLAQMRAQIDLVQLGLREEAQRLRAHLRAQLDEIFHLQRSLAERIGTLPEEGALPAIDDQGRLAAMQAIEQDFAARIDALREKLARGDALVPAMRRANELLQALQFADAALEFEAILTEMPEHVRAQEALRQARAQAEEQHRQQLASELLHDAHAAYDDGSYALCLAILTQASGIPPHGAIVQEINSLRQTAEAAFEAEEAARRERQRADREREKMARARRDADGQGAAHYAPDPWSQAEADAIEAESQYAQEAYAQASQALERAATAYKAAEVAAREARAREREAAERARDQMIQRREEAQAAGAPEHARDLWDAAEAKSVEARDTFGASSLAQAIQAFDEASLLYRQAVDVAVRERDRQRAAEASERAKGSRLSASAAGAEDDAPTPWKEAGLKLAEAEAALRQQSYADAIQGFDGAAVLYGQAERDAVEVRRRRRIQAEEVRQGMADARRNAMAADAASLSPAVWTQAEAAAATGDGVFASAAYVRATQTFEQASALYRQAAEAAREVTRRREKERTDAEQARDAAALARRAAADTQASKYAASPWSEAETAENNARAALSRQEYAAARSLFVEARRMYATAAQAAGIAADLLARRVEAIMSDAQRLLEARELASCLRRVNEVLAIKPGHPAAEELGRQVQAMLRQLETPARQAEAPETAATVRVEAPTKPSLPPPSAIAPTELIRPPAPVGPRNDTPKTSAGTVGQPDSPRADSDDDMDATVFALPRTRARVSDSPLAAVPGVADRPDVKDDRDVGPTVTTKPGRLRTRAALVAVVLVVVIAAVILSYVYWRGRPAPDPSPKAPAATPPTRLLPSPVPGQPPSRRESAEGLREQVVAARGEARRANAERLAPDQFLAAAGKEREAERAASSQNASMAQQRYQEALDGYALAKQDAERAVLRSRKETDSRVAEGRVAEARQVAQRAEAQKLAPALWAKASAAQREGEQAIKQQDVDRAASRFNEAQKAYQKAEQVALDKGATKGREEAKRVAAAGAALQRQQAEADRQAALQRQQAEADRQAALQRQQAEADRQAALQRQQAEADRQAALQRQQAEADRQAALQRQQAEADRQAALQRQQAEADRQRLAALQRQRTAVDESRSKMLARRDQAIKAEADQLAKDVFEAAQAKQNEGDRLAQRQDLAVANQVYQDAMERYTDASRRAQGAREARSRADSAKARMLVEKRSADRDAREFRAGIGEEKLADTLYEGSAFGDAAERFRSAETLFNKARLQPPSPPKPAPPPF